MRNETAFIGRFKVCPRSTCGMLNEPVARFCRECREDIQDVATTPYTKLPSPKILQSGHSTHHPLAGISPSDFYRGAMAVLESRPLSAEQQKAEDAIRSHVANIRKIVASN